jgi:hypothetical protein
MILLKNPLFLDEHSYVRTSVKFYTIKIAAGSICLSGETFLVAHLPGAFRHGRVFQQNQ